MSDQAKIEAALYVVQKFKRFKRAENDAAFRHVTQCELETSKRAHRNAEQFFRAAVEDLCAEFPEVSDDV